jgi:hypothetical protein
MDAARRYQTILIRSNVMPSLWQLSMGAKNNAVGAQPSGRQSAFL